MERLRQQSHARNTDQHDERFVHVFSLARPESSRDAASPRTRRPTLLHKAYVALTELWRRGTRETGGTLQFRRSNSSRRICQIRPITKPSASAAKISSTVTATKLIGLPFFGQGQPPWHRMVTQTFSRQASNVIWCGSGPRPGSGKRAPGRAQIGGGPPPSTYPPRDRRRAVLGAARGRAQIGAEWPTWWPRAARGKCRMIDADPRLLSSLRSWDEAALRLLMWVRPDPLEPLAMPG